MYAVQPANAERNIPTERLLVDLEVMVKCCVSRSYEGSDEVTGD